MPNQVDIALQVLSPLFQLFIFGLAFLSLSRLGLCIWKRDRVSKANGWYKVFISGLRMDIVTLCYIIIVPCLFTPLLAGLPYVGEIYIWLLRLWIMVFLCLLIMMEMATPGFIDEFDIRPNRFFIEYLIYPKEVMSMLWTGYKLQLALGLVVLTTNLYFLWGYSAWLVDGLNSNAATLAWYLRPVIAIVAVALCVMGARSTFGHRGINPSMVAFCNDNLINSLLLNSTYSVMYAAKLMRKIILATHLYPSMDRDKVIDIVQQSTVLDKEAYQSASQPTLAQHMASMSKNDANAPSKNIVILLQESLGARYVGALGGLPLTPNLDALMAQSWNFTRCYATGTRSIRGIEAVTTGFLPNPGDAVLRLSKSQTNFYTIAQTLKAKGYHTQFVYGGESHFDNMKGFLLGNGVDDIQDLETFESPEFVGSWGACDGDLYRHAHQQFEQLTAQNKPFFSLVFTTSNHTPYEYPEGKIELYNQPSATVENTVKYSDHELGQFIAKAKASDYWHNTIFVVVADHDSRVYGDELVPINGFHIPAVIFGGGIDAKQDDRLMSQVDLAPTLLSLAGVSCQHPMLGHDLTKSIERSKLRAMMQYHQNFAWLNEDDQAVIFQPHKAPVSCLYDRHTHQLMASELPKDVVDTAHAHALWGSVAYLQDYYRWDEVLKSS